MIFLDIEVIQQDPYPWVIKPPEKVKIPKNIKDEEKKADRKAEAIASQESDLRDRSSLDPLVGGVIACVGAAIGWERAPGALVNETGDEEGERKILTALQQRICAAPRAGQDDARDMPVLAWNGSGYDFGWIWKRAMRHGLWPLCARFHADKPWDKRIIDPSLQWREKDPKALWSQPVVAQLLGIEVADDVDGSQVTALWATDRARVVEHCRSDVHVLREIVRRMVLAGKIDANEPEGAAEVVVPPPRGSVADLLQRSHRLQIAKSPDEVATALEAATPGCWPDGPPTPAQIKIVLDDMSTVPVHTLRAYLVALGGRP